MALRRARAWPPFQLSRLGGASARGRRAVAAFALGAALSVLGLAGVVGGGAAARGPFTAGNAGWGSSGDGGYNRATYSIVRLDSSASAFANPYYSRDYD